MLNAADMCVLALQHHQAGKLYQAEQLYRQALQVDPGNADCYHLLGVLAFQAGRFDEAVVAIRQAIAINPGAPAFHGNLGVSEHALGHMEEALACYQEALRLQPDHVETHINLANLLQRQGKLEQALAHCHEALRLRPDSAEVHNNIASVKEAQGKLDEAVEHFRKALQLRPGISEVHNNLGNVLQKQGDFEGATAQFRKALELRADSSEAHNNLANALFGMGRTEEALPHWRQALQSRPDFAEAHSNLAVALHSLARLDEATAHYRHALRLNPAFAVAWCNLGNLLRDQLQFDEAIASFRQAIHHKPDFAEANINLGTVLLKTGNPPEALVHFQKALELQPLQAVAQSNRLFCLNHEPDSNPEKLYEDHCQWGRFAIGLAQAKASEPHANDLDPERRLRIGYVSPDLRKHALVRYLEPVLIHHDRTQVEVYCYAEVSHADAVTARLQNLVQGWCQTCNLKDDPMAERIKRDGIDILVDLAGHTGGNRLHVFARKPAPVQATWLGYLNTTGLSTIDYRLTDEVLDPPGQPHLDTEELVRLRGGFCCFAPPTDAPEVGPLPALERGQLTFGSLHSLFKLNDKVLDLWSEVLRALPGARLLLFRETLTGSAVERLRLRFGERGIEGHRLDMRQGTDSPGYLRICHEIDVSLDAFPWTGGVTTCESLWMGLPVLVLCGQRPASRNSAALVTRVGLADWVAKTTAEFVANAVRLTKDVDELAKLRASLRDRMMETLCDGKTFTRILEDAYRQMWRRWCKSRGQ